MISVSVHSSLIIRPGKGVLERRVLSKVTYFAWVIVHNSTYRTFTNLKGLNAWILPIEWPLGVKPLDLPDFETQARQLRYRALGATCRQHCIRDLLLGHHNDDQAETVLMRLSSGHKGIGLQGIKSYTSIPECWGMHGVHVSGKFESAAGRLNRLNEILHTTPYAQDPRQTLVPNRTFETGGVEIMRPLLGFSKERLVATCIAHSVKWAEDETNTDTSRTVRNTIRELLHSSRLPEALQKRSILSLSQRVHEKCNARKAIAENEFRNCQLILFDIRSGGLIVRLPKIQYKPKHANSQKHLENARVTSAFLLRRLIELVTPLEDVSLKNLRFAVESVFPQLDDTGNFDVDRILKPAIFTACDVHFRRLESPLPKPHAEPDSVSMSEQQSSRFEDLDPDFIWSLTRQPYKTMPPSLFFPPSMLASREFIATRSLSNNEDAASVPSPWSPWQLWDGRYWIRLLNRSSRNMVIRPFQPTDPDYIRATISRERWKQFHELLAVAAPDKVRWTLPAIAEVDVGDTGLGKVLALPTLGENGWLGVENERKERILEREVRYKAVTFGFEDRDGLGRNRDFITTWDD